MIRRLWREDATTFDGEFVLAGARSFPKPVRRTVPVLLGVDELVVVAAPPRSASDVDAWIAPLVRDFAPAGGADGEAFER